jgi:hypothetical protein
MRNLQLSILYILCSMSLLCGCTQNEGGEDSPSPSSIGSDLASLFSEVTNVNNEMAAVLVDITGIGHESLALDQWKQVTCCGHAINLPLEMMQGDTGFSDPCNAALPNQPMALSGNGMRMAIQVARLPRNDADFSTSRRFPFRSYLEEDDVVSILSAHLDGDVSYESVKRRCLARIDALSHLQLYEASHAASIGSLRALEDVHEAILHYCWLRMRSNLSGENLTYYVIRRDDNSVVHVYKTGVMVAKEKRHVTLRYHVINTVSEAEVFYGHLSMAIETDTENEWLDVVLRIFTQHSEIGQ